MNEDTKYFKESTSLKIGNEEQSEIKGKKEENLKQSESKCQFIMTIISLIIFISIVVFFLFFYIDNPSQNVGIYKNENKENKIINKVEDIENKKKRKDIN